MGNLNRPETEEDGIRAGALRLLKLRLQYQDLTSRTQALLPSVSEYRPLSAQEKLDEENKELRIQREVLGQREKQMADASTPALVPKDTEETPAGLQNTATEKVDPAKVNELLKKFFSKKLPLVQDPRPRVEPT